ncbi:UNVERIFIED_CONTAM: hypothetical protein FKN15_069762 [Acipenser sinensis]
MGYGLGYGVGYGLAEVNAIIIKALWRGEEKMQWIEQNLRWREKEQEEEVYEEAQSGEIDSTMLTDSQTGSKREGQPGSRAPPPANVMLEPGIPLLSTPQRFTIMGERNLPRRPIKSDLENAKRREFRQMTATREASLLMENRGLTAFADAERPLRHAARDQALQNISLEGAAAEVLLDLGPEQGVNYPALVDALKCRFGDSKSPYHLQDQLLSRCRARGEKLGAMAADIARLSHKAYRDEPTNFSQRIALDTFLRSLQPPEAQHTKRSPYICPVH